MNRFDYINENFSIIRECAKHGIIPTSVLNHYAIYSRFDYYRKLGNYVCVAVIFTSDDFDVSRRLVFKVIKEMENEN
jgi:hypothetical protein